VLRYTYAYETAELFNPAVHPSSATFHMPHGAVSAGPAANRDEASSGGGRARARDAGVPGGSAHLTCQWLSRRHL